MNPWIMSMFYLVLETVFCTVGGTDAVGNEDVGNDCLRDCNGDVFFGSWNVMKIGTHFENFR